MGELAKAVATLEEAAGESRMLREIIERLEAEISGRLDDIQGTGGQLMDLTSELDDQLAEHDFFAVKQSIETLQGLVQWETTLPAINSIALLTAIRDGMPTPDLTLPNWHPGDGTDEDHGRPKLTQEDLDRRFAADLAQADQRWQEIWGSHAWDDPDERAAHLNEDRHEARQRAVTDRTRRCSQHLMDLFDYVAETSWGALIDAVEDAEHDGAVRALTAACAVASAAESAYALYEVSLSQQYTENPSSLGAMGEFLGEFGSWLASQKGV